MNVFSGFITGVGAYGEAGRILFSRKFSWFLLFPLVILLLLFIGGNVLVTWGSDSLYHLVETKITAWIHGISWLKWVDSAAGIIIRIVLRILYFFLFIAFGGYIVLIVMSPVYSWLSERTEAHLTGKEYPFSFRQLLWEIGRGILVALRNLFFQLFISAVLFFCSFIPVAGLAVPVAIFFFSAYFYGFSFVDYVIERKKFNVRESVRYVNRNAGVVTGIGTVFALSLMIPWASIVVCSFVSLLSVVAATVAINREEVNKSVEKQDLPFRTGKQDRLPV